MDEGYWSENNVNTCADQGADSYNVPAGSRMGRHYRRDAAQTRDANTKKRMARKLGTKKGSTTHPD